MKTKPRQVADAIDDLREYNQIYYEIRDNAAAQSKAISKRLNTEGAILYEAVAMIGFRH